MKAWGILLQSLAPAPCIFFQLHFHVWCFSFSSRQSVGFVWQRLCILIKVLSCCQFTLLLHLGALITLLYHLYSCTDGHQHAVTFHKRLSAPRHKVKAAVMISFILTLEQMTSCIIKRVNQWQPHTYHRHLTVQLLSALQSGLEACFCFLGPTVPVFCLLSQLSFGVCQGNKWKNQLYAVKLAKQLSGELSVTSAQGAGGDQIRAGSGMKPVSANFTVMTLSKNVKNNLLQFPQSGKTNKQTKKQQARETRTDALIVICCMTDVPASACQIDSASLMQFFEWSGGPERFLVLREMLMIQMVFYPFLKCAIWKKIITRALCLREFRSFPSQSTLSLKTCEDEQLVPFVHSYECDWFSVC